METTTIRFSRMLRPDSLKALFECAVEGGSNYWVEKIRPVNPDDRRPYNEYMLDGFNLWERFSSDNVSKIKTVSPEQISRACELMADNYHKRYIEALNIHDMDAITGDVFLQLCCFGEVIYV